jgi:hypothetical protein
MYIQIFFLIFQYIHPCHWIKSRNPNAMTFWCVRVSSPYEILCVVLLQQTSKEHHQPLLAWTRQHFACTLACQGKSLEILLVCGQCAGLCQFQIKRALIIKGKSLLCHTDTCCHASVWIILRNPLQSTPTTKLQVRQLLMLITKVLFMNIHTE